MPQSSLNEAYTLVEKAEQLVVKGSYEEAAKLQREASGIFKQNIGLTRNREINSALELLVEQHSRRAKELSSMKELKQQNGPNTPVYKSSPMTETNSISASLASARGIQNPQPLENFINTGSIILNPNPTNNNDDIDPLTKFQVQVYNLIKPPNLITETPIDQQVKKPSGKSIEELEIENQMLKQLLVNYSENLQIYESFHKKVRNNLKNYLNTLRKDLQIQESIRKKETDMKVDYLVKENKKLESQTKKLKQRWDELVRSAKKRRGDSQKEINEP